MGRRARRRGPAESAAPERPKPKPPRGTFTDRFIAAADERPKPPWHPFPLVELCVLAGIVSIVVGLMRFDEPNGPLLLLLGLVLASLGGLDTVARDHFAGLRSHSLVLAALPAVLISGVLYFVGAPWPAVVGAAVVLFVAGFLVFRAQFRKRSGGYSFRA